MSVEGAINWSALSPSHQRVTLQERSCLQRSFDLHSWKRVSLLSCSELQRFVYQLSCFHAEITAGQWPLSVPRTASFMHVCTLGVSWEQYWIPAILRQNRGCTFTTIISLFLSIFPSNLVAGRSVGAFCRGQQGCTDSSQGGCRKNTNWQKSAGIKWIQSLKIQINK